MRLLAILPPPDHTFSPIGRDDHLTPLATIYFIAYSFFRSEMMFMYFISLIHRINISIWGSTLRITFDRTISLEKGVYRLVLIFY